MFYCISHKNKAISLILSLFLFNEGILNADEREINKLEIVQTKDNSENNNEKTKIIINNISQKNFVPEEQKPEGQKRSVALDIVTTVVNGICKVFIYMFGAFVVISCFALITGYR